MSRNKTITILSIVVVAAAALTAVSPVRNFAVPVVAIEQSGEFEGPDHAGDTDCIQAGPGNVDHDKSC